MRLKKTKMLRYFVTGFLTLGTVLSVGFLSFSGLWLIYPYLLPAILVFLLSGVVEGKVFGQSIFKGLARLKLLGPEALRRLFIVELDLYIKIAEKKEPDFINSACDFLKDYKAQRDHYRSLKKEPSHHDHDSELKEAKKRLEELRDYFFTQAIKGFPNAGEGTYITGNLAKQAKSMLIVGKQGVWFLRFFSVISMAVGLSAGFITAFAVHEAITVGLALALSATALSAIVWPIAIFAAIGATFLFYYAITDIVKKNVIEKACKDMGELFKRKLNGNEREPWLHYIPRLIVLSLVVAFVVGLTLFTTVASAGTCWFAMKKGIALIPNIPVLVGAFTRGILVPISFVTDLIYGFSNSFQTVVKLKGLLTPLYYIRQQYYQMKQAWSVLRGKENWAQIFNPFRFITKAISLPFQGLIFLGHLISVGLTSDRLANISPVVVAAACAMAEGLEDANFFVEDEAEAEANQHDHDHGNFFTTLLKIALSPLILLSGLWHWIFKKKESQLSLHSVIKQSFGIHEHTHEDAVSNLPVRPEEPTLSFDWREKERINHLFSKTKERLDSLIMIDSALAKKKRAAMDEIDLPTMSAFIKRKRQEGSSIEKAVEAYLKQRPDKTKKQTDDVVPPIKNGFVPHPEHQESHTNTNPILYDILNKPRTWASDCSFFRSPADKPTTTLSHITNALSLVMPQGG